MSEALRPAGEPARLLLRLREAGFESWLVGGCVRDRMMGRTPHDYDIASPAKPDELLALFPEAVPTGLRHGTVTVYCGCGPVEITSFRSDGEYSDGRRPDSVRFVSSLDEDLWRRDFTINAIALSLDGEIRDPTGGREDIRRGIIRCVGDPERRFSEDSLRMLRALRFSAKLGFEIEEKSAAAMERLALRCRMPAAERAGDELDGILRSERPELAGEALRLGLLAQWTESRSADPAVLERLSGLGDTVLRWAGFCTAAADPGLARKLRRPGALCRRVESAAEGAEALSGGADICEFIADRGAEDFRDSRALLSLTNPQAASLGQEFLDRAAAPALSGRELMESLGVPEGRELGALLRRLRIRVLRGECENVKTELLRAASELLQRSGEGFK